MKSSLPASAVLLWLAAYTGSAHAAGLPPTEALKALKPAPDLTITLAASEPTVRQPVHLNFDAKGRLWVVQYLQYPAPAGLKPVSVDPYLRTTYNMCPSPPPRGPKGADKITILSDPDGNGHYRKSKDFVTGLNLATSVEFGHGGVWVLQTPYLLFYPDRDGDDVPDGNPQVVLAGFGMEDAHAVANHLTWGPDGWLYGCQGSTCTAHVRDEEFQQAAWRYHPVTKQFEVFAEGGGNTFGLEWDEHGNLLTGTNYSQFVMAHYVQGGYFVKGFAKHGPLHNPYAFGYFDHVPHAGWRGGHVTQLGVIYQGGALPDRYNGKWIAPNLLANTVDVHTVTPDGSTFRTKLEADFVSSSDPCFRPVDIRAGPDGAVYVADWYDKRANHVIPEDTWDKETGRVYRIGPKNLLPAPAMDLEKQASAELVNLLSNPNNWYARTARRILYDRRDRSVVPALREMVDKNDGRLALQALWALNASGGLDDTTAAELLKHRNPDVRAWTVRLLGDAKQIVPSMRDPLVDLAKSDPSPAVRMQLACSARRLPVADAFPVIRALMTRPDDAADRYVPLLIWWAIEDKAAVAPAEVAGLFATPGAWDAPIVQKVLIERAARRLAAGRSAAELEACARLLAAAPTPGDAERVLAGMDLALQGGKLDPAPESLRDAVRRLWGQGRPSPILVRVAMRVGLKDVEPEAVRLVADRQTPAADRAAVARALGDAGGPGVVDALLPLLDPSEPKEVRAAAVAAVAAVRRFDDPRVAPAVIKAYPTLPADARTAAAVLLAGRPASAKALADAVTSGAIKPELVPAEQVRRMLLHGDPALTAAVSKLWGTAAPADERDKAAAAARARKLLAAAGGDPAAGRLVFQKTCAACHAVRGEGARTAPDLTGFDRQNAEYLVQSVVDPSAVIRPEYATYVVRTTDGEVLTGTLVEAGDSVTVVDGAVSQTVPRDRVAKAEPSPVSRMPEKLLDGLSDEQVRDLFAYVAP